MLRGRLSFSMSRCVPQSLRGCCRAHPGAPRVLVQPSRLRWTELMGTVSARPALGLPKTFFANPNNSICVQV